MARTTEPLGDIAPVLAKVWCARESNRRRFVVRGGKCETRYYLMFGMLPTSTKASREPRSGPLLLARSLRVTIRMLHRFAWGRECSMNTPPCLLRLAGVALPAMTIRAARDPTSSVIE